MNIPEKLKLLRVWGPATSKKTGKEYMFAVAESAGPGSPGAFSTIRWRCVRQCAAFPAAWKAGAEVQVSVVRFELRDGVGEFDVPEGR